MPRTLTDEEIDSFVAESKPLPKNWKTRLSPRTKSNSKHDQRDLEVEGESGNRFRVIIRKNAINPLDFSIILTFKDKDGIEFVLRRYNGKHPSQHTNRLEKARGKPNSSFRNTFHIHKATQRYQEEGLPIDGYAEETTEYASFDTALQAFVESNGFVRPGDDEPSLFDSNGGA
jgi:hypothetical protein